MEESSNQLLNLDDQESVMDFLREPTIKIAETITGILVSEKNDWKLSVGKLIQSVATGSFLTQLGREIEQYREKGKIKENYFATHKSRATLYELLKFLDEQVPDEELFKALKSIFFCGISIDSTAYEESLAYEFLQTAKQLSGTEILILRANFELAKGNESDEAKKYELGVAQYKRSVWKRVVAAQMGYGELHTIVEKYENNLENLGLIATRNGDNRFQDEFEPTTNYRLTALGMIFCEYIGKYE